MKHAVVILLVFLLTACVEIGPKPRPLPFERITPPYHSHYSGLREPLRLVVLEPDTFAELWKKAYGSAVPIPPVPDVDFTRESVIVVAMGEQASGGYAIRVEAVVAIGEDFRVAVESTTPGKDCMVTLALTQPHDMVRVPSLVDRVEFSERTRARRCR